MSTFCSDNIMIPISYQYLRRLGKRVMKTVNADDTIS
jgi:hypothetical protein